MLDVRLTCIGRFGASVVTMITNSSVFVIGLVHPIIIIVVRLVLLLLLLV